MALRQNTISAVGVALDQEERGATRLSSEVLRGFEPRILTSNTLRAMSVSR